MWLGRGLAIIDSGVSTALYDFQRAVTHIISAVPQNTSGREAGKALLSSFNFLWGRAFVKAVLSSFSLVPHLQLPPATATPTPTHAHPQSRRQWWWPRESQETRILVFVRPVSPGVIPWTSAYWLVTQDNGTASLGMCRWHQWKGTMGCLKIVIF